MHRQEILCVLLHDNQLWELLLTLALQTTPLPEWIQRLSTHEAQMSAAPLGLAAAKTQIARFLLSVVFLRQFSKYYAVYKIVSFFLEFRQSFCTPISIFLSFQEFLPGFLR